MYPICMGRSGFASSNSPLHCPPATNRPASPAVTPQTLGLVRRGTRGAADRRPAVPVGGAGRVAVKGKRRPAVVEMLSPEFPKRQVMGVVHHGRRLIAHPETLFKPPGAKIAVFAGCMGQAHIEAADPVKEFRRQSQIVRGEEPGMIRIAIVVLVEIINEQLACGRIRIVCERVHRPAPHHVLRHAGQTPGQLRQPIPCRPAIIIREGQPLAPGGRGIRVLRRGRPGVRLPHHRHRQRPFVRR